MRLVRVTILVLLAAVLAAEPVIHTHPLSSPAARESSDVKAPNFCAICAIGTNTIVTHAPAIIAPQVMVGIVVSVIAGGHSFDAPLPAASRAPPAA